MADIKVSIRFFGDEPVRSVWDDESAKWWMCAADAVGVLVKTRNPRIYWATVKRRNSELFADCKQLKLPARDGKRYLTDVIDDHALSTLIAVVRSTRKDIFLKWLESVGNSVDEKSKRKAYELFESGMIDEMEVGTVRGLQQIHGDQSDRWKADSAIGGNGHRGENGIKALITARMMSENEIFSLTV